MKVVDVLVFVISIIYGFLFAIFVEYIVDMMKLPTYMEIITYMYCPFCRGPGINHLYYNLCYSYS
jgi:fructose-specific phosphotransferase system IIC component